MSFTPNIPNLSDFILQSGAQLRANWTEIFDAFSQDHVNLIDDNKGKHNKLTLRNQSIDPVTGSDQVAVYNKNGTDTLPQLFYMPNNAQTPIQLSYQSIVNTGTSQYSFIAGPFIFYAGQVINFTNHQNIILSPTTTLISVLCTVYAEYIPSLANPPTPKPALAATGVITGTSKFQIQCQFKALFTQPLNLSYIAIGLVT
jgi:hypothetical protein